MLDQSNSVIFVRRTEHTESDLQEVITNGATAVGMYVARNSGGGDCAFFAIGIK